jgi:hypothetical protein
MSEEEDARATSVELYSIAQLAAPSLIIVAAGPDAFAESFEAEWSSRYSSPL